MKNSLNKYLTKANKRKDQLVKQMLSKQQYKKLNINKLHPKYC